MKKAKKQDISIEEAAKPIYERFMTFLTHKKAFEEVDTGTVWTCAIMEARINRFEKLVEEKGEIEEYPNGAIGLSAYYKVLTQERMQYAQYCRALGFTPQGRERMATMKDKRQAKTPSLILIKRAK